MSDIEDTDQPEGGAEEMSMASQELSGDQMEDGESSGPQSEGPSPRSGERVEAGIADQGQTSEEMGDEEGDDVSDHGDKFHLGSRRKLRQQGTLLLPQQTLRQPEEGEQTPPGLDQA